MSEAITFPDIVRREAEIARADGRRPISASAFVWRAPESFPRRRWLYGPHYIRGFLSVMIAPGEVGKTSLLVVEALALATGRALLGIQPRERCRTWLVNLEDPSEELERRLVAAMAHYRIDPAEVEGWLFLDSGREMPVMLAMTDKNAPTINRTASEAIVATMQANAIDVAIFDPLVRLHALGENDNSAIDMLADELGRIADVTDSSIMLAHHSRKTFGAEITVEDGRGASALLAASRTARALNKMSKEQAAEWEIENPRLFFRADNGKSNLAPPPEKADWFELRSVPLGNGGAGDGPFDLATDEGDKVAVVVPWEPPGALDAVQTVAQLEEIQRRVAAAKPMENYNATEWVGHIVGDVLELDSRANRGHRARIRKLLGVWYASGAIEIYEDKNDHGEWKKYVRVGSAAQ